MIRRNRNKRKYILPLSALCLLTAVWLTGCTSSLYELYDLSEEAAEDGVGENGTTESAGGAQESDESAVTGDNSSGESGGETISEAEDDGTVLTVLVDVSEEADIYAYLGIWLADAYGYFEEAGLQVEFAEADAEYMLVRVANGMADLCVCSAEDVILAHTTGTDLEVLGAALLPQGGADASDDDTAAAEDAGASDGDADAAETATAYTSVLVTRTMTVDSEPETVRAFIHAVESGLEDALTEPARALKEAADYLPENAADLLPEADELTDVLSACDGLGDDDSLFGMMDADVWSNTVNYLITDGEVAQDIDPLDCFTNNVL